MQFDLKKFGQIYNKKAKVKVELLQTTIVSQADFECSKYSRSIYVIDVKSNQNFSCGLRNISDNTFGFSELENIRIPLYREDQFLIHGLNVQHDIHSTVLSDEKHQFMD